MSRIRGSDPAEATGARLPDRATYRGARALHRLMTGSRLLTLRGVIAHGIYAE
jgi:hypothetical protein